ncbi:hypothetical protein BGZ50_004022 [Haplosporangium sp. Z 11]|nr:hypothetical protein BGZ50_004022 [Haplosporangium sp. Z 11]
MDTTLFPDSLLLRRIINRHTKESLIDIAIRWIALYTITRAHENESESDNDFDMDLDHPDAPVSTRNMTLAIYQGHVKKQYEAMREKGNKKRVVNRILGVDWRNGLSARQVAELDLLYYSKNPDLKSWKTLKMDYDDQTTQINIHVDPAKIERTLSHYLAPYFVHHVQILRDKEMIWIRISIHDGQAADILPPPTTIVYLIWFTNSEYLLSGMIKAEWRDFIMEALLRLFKASEVKEWPLSGRSPKSLAELLLLKESQGALSRYRLNQLDDNPLSNTLKKRKTEDPHVKYARGMQDIKAEDMNKIVSRERVVATEFGPNAQPTLQRVDVQLNLPYTQKARDFELGRLNRQPFPIKVVFEGSNVIEGIKSLIPLGVAQPGMPRFLTELHSMATNRLTVDLDEQGTDTSTDGDRMRVTPG